MIIIKGFYLYILHTNFLK